jgi:hypothetical protein
VPDAPAQSDARLNGHAAAFTDAAPTRPRPADSDGRPWVRLPEDEWEYRGLVGSVAALMRDEGWMRQGDSIVTLDAERFMLVPVTPEGNLTDIEAQVRFWKKKKRRKVPTPITLQAARIIVRSSLTRAFLNTISMLSRCPVLIADDELREITQGFDTLAGIYVHPRARTPQVVPFENAKDYLLAPLVDFRTATDADLSRIVAMLITPALMRSKLLGDARGPIDVVEADESQTGKGYLVRLRAAFYADTPHTITQRSGGVGSLDESVMAAIVALHSFPSLDNARGLVNSPTLESALTEKSVECRVPFRGSVAVDPSPITFSMTSNGAELTIDLARRANIVRLLKQPDSHRFREWPEGSLLEHVRANQPLYLGAVWSVLREWHRRGCPLAEENREHDLVRWSQAIRYIVRDMLGLADPFADYRAVQRAKSTPALTWVRAVLLGVKKASKFGLLLKAHDLWGICVENGIEVPGLSAADAQREDDATRTKALQGIGRRLKAAFGDAERIEVDGVPVHRVQRQIEREKWERSYIFGDVPGSPLDGAEDASPTQMELPV